MSRLAAVTPSASAVSMLNLYLVWIDQFAVQQILDLSFGCLPGLISLLGYARNYTFQIYENFF